MSLTSLHLVRLASAAAILATLTGCQAIVSSPSAAQVRVVDASPDAPSIDIYQGDNAIAYNLGFGDITSYVSMTSGTYTISAATAGTRQALSLAKPAFAPASQYTLLIANTSGSLQQLILKDQSKPAPTGQAALRFINEATRSGPVDIYLVPTGHSFTMIDPTITNIPFGFNTGYKEIPAGTYTLAILPTGTTPASTTAPSYTGAQITYPSTEARTIILIDQPLPTTPGLEVITAEDYSAPATND
jgi:hypothetical protein